jgi:hypothetical protein
VEGGVRHHSGVSHAPKSGYMGMPRFYSCLLALFLPTFLLRTPRLTLTRLCILFNRQTRASCTTPLEDTRLPFIHEKVLAARLTMPGKDLCLLSLDGGGVRGLSTLQILKQLMETIDPDSPPKPSDYFDMIGGTSTGGYEYQQSQS